MSPFEFCLSTTLVKPFERLQIKREHAADRHDFYYPEADVRLSRLTLEYTHLYARYPTPGSVYNAWLHQVLRIVNG